MRACGTPGTELSKQERKVPRICFVPNTTEKEYRDSTILVWVFPVAWLYLPLTFSTLLTIVLSHLAFRKLLAGTTASILSRLRIIMVNFRNIFVHILYVLTLAVLDITAIYTGTHASRLM